MKKEFVIVFLHMLLLGFVFYTIILNITVKARVDNLASIEYHEIITSTDNSLLPMGGGVNDEQDKEKMKVYIIQIIEIVLIIISLKISLKKSSIVFYLITVIIFVVFNGYIFKTPVAETDYPWFKVNIYLYDLKNSWLKNYSRFYVERYVEFLITYK